MALHEILAKSNDTREYNKSLLATMLEHDITVTIELNNNRTSPTPGDFFGCMFEINVFHYDARMLLGKIGGMHPGKTYKNVPVKFLCANTVIPQIHIGDTVNIKEGKIIGQATISQIVYQND